MIAINLEEIATDDCERGKLQLLESYCRCILDVRNQLICNLSAEEGEWAEGDEIIRLAPDYSNLVRLAIDTANAFDQSEWVFFAMMNKLAAELGEPTILPWDTFKPSGNDGTRADAQRDSGVANT